MLAENEDCREQRVTESLPNVENTIAIIFSVLLSAWFAIPLKAVGSILFKKILIYFIYARMGRTQGAAGIK